MEEMSAAECRDILSASRLGVLALSHAGKAYAIPLYFAYDGDHVWFQCHPGLKDEYMESTDEACLVVTHSGAADIWESVQVFGPTEKASLSNDVESAKAALFKVPFPPAEGNFPKGRPVRTDDRMYYLKLTPSHVEGKKSTWR